MTPFVQIVALICFTVILLAVLDSIDKAKGNNKNENNKKEGKK